MVRDAGPFHLYKPGPPLSGCVDFFWIYDAYAPPHRRERLLPTGRSELVFAVDANGRSVSGLSGPRSESLTLETSTPFSVAAVHFRPGGALPFFGVPATELRNQIVTLDLLWGRDAGGVAERLWEERTPGKRFSVLEDALLTRARGRFQTHAAVRYALDAFDRSHGMCGVAGVLPPIGLSPRRFRELFRAEVGLSPKAFCRVRRFNEVLTRIEQLAEVDWADVAISCGYFDQAHFNHDFRAFAGLTPTAYLRDRVARMHVVVSGDDQARGCRERGESLG